MFVGEKGREKKREEKRKEGEEQNEVKKEARTERKRERAPSPRAHVQHASVCSFKTPPCGSGATLDRHGTLSTTTTSTSTGVLHKHALPCVVRRPFFCASLLMAARDVGGGTASARRWRERRQRSWWRHEQLSVAAALASARHHSAGPGVVSWREEQHEEVEQDAYDGSRALNTPPPGTRSGVLQDPGPPWVEAVTVGYVAAGAASPVVAPVAHDELDTASVQYLLQQSLLARVEEEEEAREQEEDKRQEEAVVTRMQRLEAEVMKYAGRDRSQLSDLEKAAVVLVAHSDASGGGGRGGG